MENFNVRTLIQRQNDENFAGTTNNAFEDLQQTVSETIPTITEEEDNTAMLNNIGLEIQRQGGN